MSVSVTIQPSGRTFIAEPTETLLDSALRNGVSFSYNCNNGTCGKCSARLISGELGDSLPQDYVFKAHEKANQALLLCRARPRTDLVIEATEADTPDAIPQQTIETIVHKIEAVTDDIRIIQLRTPRSQTLQFLAGQHVCLQMKELAPRSKSIASCPCNGMYLQFHVREVPGDDFSDYVFHQLNPREKVSVNGPFGQFLLDENSNNPIIFIAFDTGIAPIKSLIEHAIALDESQPMFLYWLMDVDSRHYQDNYCRSWEDALDNFTYRPVKISYQDQHSVDINRLQQALKHTAAEIVSEHTELADSDIYINGPAWLFCDMHKIFIAEGVPEQQIHVDAMKRY